MSAQRFLADSSRLLGDDRAPRFPQPFTQPTKQWYTSIQVLSNFNMQIKETSVNNKKTAENSNVSKVKAKTTQT